MKQGSRNDRLSDGCPGCLRLDVPSSRCLGRLRDANLAADLGCGLPQLLGDARATRANLPPALRLALEPAAVVEPESVDPDPVISADTGGQAS